MLFVSSAHRNPRPRLGPSAPGPGGGAAPGLGCCDAAFLLAQLLVFCAAIWSVPPRPRGAVATLRTATGMPPRTPLSPVRQQWEAECDCADHHAAVRRQPDDTRLLAVLRARWPAGDAAIPR